MKTELNTIAIIDALKLQYMSFIEKSEKADDQVDCDKYYATAQGFVQSIDTIERMAELID